MARDELTDARSAWWDDRLYNWALWKTGGRGTGHGIATDGHYGGDVTPPPKPLLGQAYDTDALVLRLPAEQGEALEAYYCWGGTIDERARELEIHRNTLRNRVDAAKRGLDRMWWEKLGRRAPEPVR